MKASLSMIILVTVVLLPGCGTPPPPTFLRSTMTNDPEEIRSLIEKGADVNAKENGRPPLIWAAAYSKPEILKLLIEKGADVNVKDSFGETSLASAAYSGCTECAKLLLASGANVNSVNNDGGTPLFNATGYGQTEIAKLLIAKGGKAPVRNKAGRMAKEQKQFNDQQSQAKIAQAVQNQQSSGGGAGGAIADSLLSSFNSQMTGKLREQGSQMGGAGKVFAHTEADLIDKTTEQAIQQGRESRQQSQQMQATGNQSATGRDSNTAPVTKVASSAGAKNTRPPNSRRIYGVVASGYPWSDAKVSVKASGDDLEVLDEHVVSTITNAEGGWFVDIPWVHAKIEKVNRFIIKVEKVVDGVKKVMFSKAEPKDDGKDTRTNVTPITDSIVQVSAYDASGAIGAAAVWNSPVSKNVDKIAAGITKILGPKCPKNPFSDPLVADGKNSYDRCLDNIKIAINAEVVTVADVKGKIMATTPFSNIISNDVKGDKQTVTPAESKAAEEAADPGRAEMIAALRDRIARLDKLKAGGTGSVKATKDARGTGSAKSGASGDGKTSSCVDPALIGTWKKSDELGSYELTFTPCKMILIATSNACCTASKQQEIGGYTASISTKSTACQGYDSSGSQRCGGVEGAFIKITGTSVFIIGKSTIGTPFHMSYEILNNTVTVGGDDTYQKQ